MGSGLARHGALVVMLACAACSSGRYGEATADFSQAVSDLRTSSAALNSREVESRLLYYAFVNETQPGKLRFTDGCFDVNPAPPMTPAPPSNCFVTTDRQLKQEQEAAALIGALEVAVTPKLAPDRPYTTLEYLRALGIPDACAPPIEEERRRLAGASSGPVPQDRPATPSGPPDTAPAAEGPRNAAETEAVLLRALERYAKALAAIADEKDAEAYKDAASKLGGSLGTLAGTVGTVAGAAGAAVGPIVTAASNLAFRLRLASLERDRYEALKQAVLAACVPVHSVALAEGIFLQARWYNSKTYIADIFGETSRLQGEGNSPAALERARPLVLRAAELRRATGPNPKPIAEKIAKTHDALVIAVVNGQGQTEALAGLLNDLLEQTAALKDSLQKKGGGGA